MRRTNSNKMLTIWRQCTSGMILQKQQCEEEEDEEIAAAATRTQILLPPPHQQQRPFAATKLYVIAPLPPTLISRGEASVHQHCISKTTAAAAKFCPASTLNKEIKVPGSSAQAMMVVFCPIEHSSKLICKCVVVLQRERERAWTQTFNSVFHEERNPPFNE